MIRNRKSAATVLASLLVLGTAGVAAAQRGMQPNGPCCPCRGQPSAPPNSPPSQNQPPAGQNPQPKSEKEVKQEQLQREKVAFKDRVHEEITAADQQIGALYNMTKTDTGADKKRDEDYQKQLWALKDHLETDLDRIDKASIDDWTDVKPGVDRDLVAMDTHLRMVALVTHVQVPTTGAANKQPQ